MDAGSAIGAVTSAGLALLLLKLARMPRRRGLDALASDLAWGMFVLAAVAAIMFALQAIGMLPESWA